MSIIAKRRYTVITRRRSSLSESIFTRRGSSTVFDPSGHRKYSTQLSCPSQILDGAHSDIGGIVEETDDLQVDQSTEDLCLYELLRRAISRGSFPEVAIVVQDILRHQSPILNKEKLTIYLDAISSRHYGIINEVLSGIRPCALFPAHYKFKLMMEALKTHQEHVVHVVSKNLFPRFRLSTEDTFQLLEQVLLQHNVKKVKSICAPLKSGRALQTDKAYYLLLKAIETSQPSIVINIFRVIKPKKRLSTVQKVQLLRSSIKTKQIEIVRLAVKLGLKAVKSEYSDILHDAVQSTFEMFQYLVSVLKPTLTEDLREDLCMTAYLSRNKVTVCHIIHTYYLSDRVKESILRQSIEDHDLHLIRVLLSKMSEISDDNVRGIISLCLRCDCVDLLDSFTGSQRFSIESVGQFISEALGEFTKDSCPLATSSTKSDTNTTILSEMTYLNKGDVIKKLIASLHLPEHTVIENVLCRIIESGNRCAFNVICHIVLEDRENVIIGVLKKTLKLKLERDKNSYADMLLQTIEEPSPRFLFNLDDILQTETFCNQTKEVINYFIQNHKSKILTKETEL